MGEPLRGDVMKISLALLALFSIFLSSCQKQRSSLSQGSSTSQLLNKNPLELDAIPYAMDSPPILIENARIMTVTGPTLERANLLMQSGRIKKISTDKIKVKDNTQIIDGTGMTLTPGLIDVHSHMGIFPSPHVDAHADGNEMSRPVTADVWAEHGFWPQDPDLWRALAGGVTTIQVLPGSGNLIGGRTMTLKLIPRVSPREMRFHGAPFGLKMACGENPKRTYRDKGIMTRMGNMAQSRKAYQEALEYMRDWEEANKMKGGKLPKRNFVSETLAQVLKGDILVHFHCYRADDISNILDLAEEFHFSIRTIHHGLEAYKVAPRLGQKAMSVATWADWWGFKAEAYDGIPYNIALLHQAGVKPIVHSDSPSEVRFLNLEAGKALAFARELGMSVSEEQALSWVTTNAAWALGVDDRVGSLDAGKMADVVMWDGHPFSTYTQAQMVFINGKVVFDRKQQLRPRSDFEVGYNDMAFHDGREFRQKPQRNQTILWSDPLASEPPSPLKTFYLKNVSAFIDGKWLTPAFIHVRNGVVVAIHKEGQFPKDTPVIDGRNQYLTPGLIDSYSKLGLFEIPMDSSAQDIWGDSTAITPGYLAADALNRQSIRLPIHRRQGITTTISNNSNGLVGGQGVAFDLDPSQPILNTSMALWGSLTKDGHHRRGRRNRSAVWSDLKQLLNDINLYQRNPKAYEQGNLRPLMIGEPHLQALVPYLYGRQPWVMHLNRSEDIQNLIDLKIFSNKLGFQIQFVILEGAEAWLKAQELKQHRIPVMLAPSQQTPNSMDKTMARFDQAAYLRQAGVTVIIVDLGELGAPRLRQEAGFAVKYGLSHEEAIRAITETPAKLFGLKGRGAIQVGQPAHMVLWSSDPLEVTSQAVRIWIGGKEQSLDTRQKSLAEKYFKSQ
jgi:imidazolonepropionase-like amidohydrolase